MDMLNYLSVILGPFMTPKVLATLGTILGLILADFIFGVLTSLKSGEFSFNKLAQFVQTSLVPYVGGLLVLALFANSNTELSALFFTIAATITVKFVADIASKASQLFGGIQFQSPIAVKKDVVATEPVVVSPQTDVATNTPASEKTPVDPEDDQTA